MRSSDEKSQVCWHRLGSLAAVLVCASVLGLLGSLPKVAGAQAMPGHAAVSPVGSAEYLLPIRLPQAPVGPTPRLALRYSSSGVKGMLGQGWTLEGMSAIARCLRTAAQDGSSGGVSYSASDALCLDGQRLVKVPPIAGSSADEYRPELDSSTRVVATAAQQSFTVWTKDGLIKTYAYTASPSGVSVPRSWHLTQIADRKGRAIRISYTGTSSPIPSFIRYGGHKDDTDAQYRWAIQFTYESRHDPLQGYEYGGAITLDQRLKAISLVFNGNEPVKAYTLSYLPEDPDIPGPSKLATVQECTSGTGAACLAPHQFTYFPQASGALTEVTAVPSSGNPNPQALPGANDKLHQGDFNGDGLADFLVTADGTAGSWSGYRLYLGTGDGFNLSASGSFPTYSDNIYLGDFDGDGRTDFIVTQNPTYFGQIPSWGSNKLFFSRTNGVSTTFVESASPIANGPTLAHLLHMGDFNGDGRTDFLEVGNAGFIGIIPGYRLFISTGSDFALVESVALPSTSAPIPSGYYQINLGDFNGDGLTDVIVTGSSPRPDNLGYIDNYHMYVSTGSGLSLVTSSSTVGPSYKDRLYPGDFNGDGLTDILTINEVGMEQPKWLGYKIYFSTGARDGVPPFNVGSIGSFPTWNDDLSVGDFNGDGLSDVLAIPHRWIAGGSGYRLYLSNGATLKEAVVGNVPTRGDRVIAGDYNGDGHTDVFLTYDKNSSGTTSWTGNRLFLSQNQKRGVLKSVNNGLGKVAEFNYDVVGGWRLSDGGVYVDPQTVAYPRTHIASGTWVVSSMDRLKGQNSFETTNYYYKYLKYDYARRAFLGFGAVTEKNNSHTLETSYRQDWPYIGKVSTVYYKPGAPTSGAVISVQHQYGCVDSNYSGTYTYPRPSNYSAPQCQEAPGKVYFPYVSSSVESGTDLLGQALPSLTRALDYDRYGNQVHSSEHYDDGYSKATANTYLNDESGWLIGRLQTTRTTKSAP